MSQTSIDHGERSSQLVAETPPPARRIALDAPWEWLEAGWRDICRVPQISIAYGAAFAIAAGLIALGLARFGEESLFLALTGGFLLIGPFVAAGLYETSRQLAAGITPSLGSALSAPFQARGQLSFLGVMLLMIFMIWLQLAFLLMMLFLGTHTPPSAEGLMHTLLMTPRGLALLVVGTTVGAILASVVFAVSALSAPMLLERRMDAVSAARASLGAVIANPKPMLLWAALIVATMSAGFATILIGLAVAFPLVGHATWHAYADVFADDAADR
jgi:uncharacterized membrane protein